MIPQPPAHYAQAQVAQLQDGIKRYLEWGPAKISADHFVGKTVIPNEELRDLIDAVIDAAGENDMPPHLRTIVDKYAALAQAGKAESQ